MGIGFAQISENGPDRNRSDRVSLLKKAGKLKAIFIQMNFCKNRYSIPKENAFIAKIDPVLVLVLQNENLW